MKTFLITISLFLMEVPLSYGQTGPWNIDDKERILGAIWEKPLSFFRTGSVFPNKEFIRMDIPDSALGPIQDQLDNMAAFYTEIYYFYVLKQQHKEFDTIHVELFKQSNDSVALYIAEIDVHTFKTRPPTRFSLMQALFFLCPRAKYEFYADDEIVEVFQAKETITPEKEHYYFKYAEIIAGITGKCLLPGLSYINRIVIVWLDPREVPYIKKFYIHSKEFSKVFANF